jgi:uncharacterized protein (TIGR03067 family)
MPGYHPMTRVIFYLEEQDAAHKLCRKQVRFTSYGEFLMKRAIFGVLAMVLFVAADDAAKKDLDKMQGVWETIAMEVNGRDVFADGVRLKFTFKGNKISVDGDEEIKKDYGGFTVKLDPSKNPKAIDMVVNMGERKDTQIPGIYEFKGDDLRICSKLDANERPMKFASPENENQVLMTLKRVKQ